MQPKAVDEDDRCCHEFPPRCRPSGPVRSGHLSIAQYEEQARRSFGQGDAIRGGGAGRPAVALASDDCRTVLGLGLATGQGGGQLAATGDSQLREDSVQV